MCGLLFAKLIDDEIKVSESTVDVRQFDFDLLLIERMMLDEQTDCCVI